MRITDEYELPSRDSTALILLNNENVRPSGEHVIPSLSIVFSTSEPLRRYRNSNNPCNIPMHTRTRSSDADHATESNREKMVMFHRNLYHSRERHLVLGRDLVAGDLLDPFLGTSPVSIVAKY
jgi:hypothetical protein